MTVKKATQENKGLLAVLTSPRSLGRELEAAGLLAFLLLFVCGPLSVSTSSAMDIANSYKLSYEKTVDELSDLLVDASESPSSYSAAVLRGTLTGDSRIHPPASSTMPRKPGDSMDGNQSSSTLAWEDRGGNMGGDMMGDNNEDASSTRMVQLQLSPADIKTLQQFLNKNGFDISQSGEGSLGNETTSFGPRTVQAFRKFLQTIRDRGHNPNNNQGGGMGSSTPYGGREGHDNWSNGATGSSSPQNNFRGQGGSNIRQGDGPRGGQIPPNF